MLRITAALALGAFLAIPPCAYYVHRQANPLPAPTPRRDLAEEARADLSERRYRPLSASLEALLSDAYDPVPTQSHSLLLRAAPDFTLADVDGKTWSLAEHCGHGPVVLVFYYGYHCNHCVSQLFALDKDIDKFRELGATVVAVSADPPDLTSQRFRQYGRFKFRVLSDPENKVATLYETFVPNATAGAEGSLMHGTFVIGRDGKVAWVNLGDAPFTENRTLLVEAARRERRR